MTGSYMKRKTGLKWVNLLMYNVTKNGLQYFQSLLHRFWVLWIELLKTNTIRTINIW